MTFLFGDIGNDSLVGGLGDDTLDGGAGDDTLKGGLDNDIYAQVPGSTDYLEDTQGIDWLDFTAANFGVDIDLSHSGMQTVDSRGNAMQLVGTFENVRGSSFDDLLTGNASINLIEGGGGRDLLNGLAGNDTLQGGFPQLVYLDFDTHTEDHEYEYTPAERNEIQDRLEAAFGWPFNVKFTQVTPSVGRFSTVAINAGDVPGSDIVIAGIAQQLDWRNADSASFAEVNANELFDQEEDPATEIINVTFTLVAHELGHLLGLRHIDSFGAAATLSNGDAVTRGVLSATDSVPSDKPEFWTALNCATYSLCGVGDAVNYLSPGYGSQFISLAGPIIINEKVNQGGVNVGHVLPSGSIYILETEVAVYEAEEDGSVSVAPIEGVDVALPVPINGTLDEEAHVLTINWQGPVPTQSYVTMSYDFDRFRPGYRGPEAAVETRLHILASPNSVGSAEDDAKGVTIVGERELVKLAFADVGGSVFEDELPMAPNSPMSLGGMAKEIELIPLAVPNQLPVMVPALENESKEFFVSSVNVIGSIELDNGQSENDVYAFQSTQKNQLLTIEVLSISLRHRLSDTIDSMLRVYDANGVILDYHGVDAHNDDGVDNQDAVLLDLLLPEIGTYYIEVDTVVGSGGDTDAGSYELFAYTFLAENTGRRLGGDGDVIIGADGIDIAIASSGDDIIVGDIDIDGFRGAVHLRHHHRFSRAHSRADSVKLTIVVY